jgi:hypothetical protein
MRQGNMPYRRYAGNKQNGKLASDSFKAKSRTYFFDIREAKSGKPYLTVTESRYDRGSGQRERSRLIFYPDDMPGFQNVFHEMVQNLLDMDVDAEPAPRRRSYGGRRGGYNRQQSFDDYDPEEE